MFMPSRTKDWLTSLRLALNIHYENCSTCKSCVFKSYNKEAFDGKNERANDEFSKIKKDAANIADIDINFIMNHLGVNNRFLKDFLNKSKDFMQDNDFEGLKNVLMDRERFLKGENRSRLYDPGKYKEDEWFAGTYLDYRYSNAKTIIKDIFESEKLLGEIK